MTMSRIDPSVFRRQPWRIHGLTPDFEVEDVWRIAAPGAGPQDFPQIRATIEDAGAPAALGRLAGLLLAVHRRAGARMGWDHAASGPDGRVRSLRRRLPSDLEPAVATGRSLLAPVYATDREAAAEVADATVHGVLHLGWTDTGEDGPGLIVTVLARPHGRIGRVYLRAIAPLRRLIMWPRLTAAWEQAWRDREPVSGSLGYGSVDPGSLSLVDLEPDYVDEFVLTTTTPGNAREWAADMFETAIDRTSRTLIFETLLRMRIAPDGTSGTVAGWDVASETDTHLLMAAAGPLVECRLLVRRGPDRVHLMTAMRYRRRLGRLVWTALAPRHRGLAPWLVRQAASTLRAGR
ncbi:DUF2867 domain-containing protein [Nocardiopsis coralliicola]